MTFEMESVRKWTSPRGPKFFIKFVTKRTNLSLEVPEVLDHLSRGDPYPIWNILLINISNIKNIYDVPTSKSEAHGFGLSGKGEHLPNLMHFAYNTLLALRFSLVFIDFPHRRVMDMSTFRTCKQGAYSLFLLH